MTQIKAGVGTWARENRLAATAKAERQCTLCGKYHTATKSKHPQCLWTALSPTEYYSFLKIDNLPVCMVCFEQVKCPRSKANIVKHLLEHHPKDLAIAGFSPYFLARENP
jgi:hypothetical protein